MAETILIECPRDGCRHVHELETEIEPADPHYGADADGNRGMYVGPYLLEPDPPTVCPKCKAEYDDDDLDNLRNAIQAACEAWEPPEPDYDYDPYGE